MNTLIAWIEIPTRTTQLGGAQGPDLTRYFTVLGILLIAILALAFGFKRLFAGAMNAKAAKRHLAIVDLLPLGGKQRLAVVRCYDRTFAIGLGDKEVALIAELDAVNAEGRGIAPPSEADRAGFARVLRAQLGDADVADSPAPAKTAGPAPASSVGKRIRDLIGAGGVLG